MKPKKLYYLVIAILIFWNVFLTPIKDEEVESLIKNMNASKLGGPYSNIFKLSCSVLSKPLVKLINFSFSQGIFPGLFKFVIPVFKKGGNWDYNNYMPISLISNIGKLIEKIVFIRLYSFLEKNYLLFERHMDLERKCQLIILWLISPIEFKKPMAMVSMYVEFMQTLNRSLIQLIIIYYWSS